MRLDSFICKLQQNGGVSDVSVCVCNCWLVLVLSHFSDMTCGTESVELGPDFIQSLPFTQQSGRFSAQKHNSNKSKAGRN